MSLSHTQEPSLCVCGSKVNRAVLLVRAPTRRHVVQTRKAICPQCWDHAHYMSPSSLAATLTSIYAARLSRQHLEVSVHPSEGAHIRVMGKNSVYTDTGQGDCVALKEGDSLVCPHGTTIFLLKDRESGEMILPIRIAPDEVQHPAPSGLSAPTASAQPDVVVLDDSDEEADCIADSSADAAPDEVAGQWSVAPVCTSDAGPAVWHVRRNGRFVAYEAPVQSVIERAWREGLPTAHVRIPAGSAPFSGEFTIDFAALRQVQTADSSRWRPIRRDPISNGADDPLAPVSDTAARLQAEQNACVAWRPPSAPRLQLIQR